MAYKPLRKDLTETTQKCDFCPRFLTSLKAYVLEDTETGKIAYAGPKCAEENLAHGYSIKGIPDLTKFTLSKDVGNENGGGGGNKAGAIDSPRRQAIEYIILREEKLVSELNCSYPVLKDYYESMRDKELTDSEISHINNIENKAPHNLKLSVLQRCYNYLFWIDIAIDKLPDNKTDFLKDIRSKVARRTTLTNEQKTAVNKWLENIDGVPCLK